MKIIENAMKGQKLSSVLFSVYLLKIPYGYQRDM